MKSLLQNLLWSPNSMILAPVRLLRKLTYLGKVGNLRRMRIRGQKRGFGPKWSFAKGSQVLFCFLVGLCIFARIEALVKGDLTRVIAVTPGQEVPLFIPLGNDEDVPIRVTLRQFDYSYNANGENFFSEIGTNSRSNAKWLELHTDQVVLQPHTCTDVFYKLRIPNDPTLCGSYWSLILIEPDQVQKSVSSSSAGVQIQVKIRYAYQIISNINQGRADLKIVHSNYQDKQLSFDVLNMGQVYLTPKLLLQLYDRQGQLVRTLSASAQKLLPDSSVRYILDVSDLQPGSYSALLLLDSGEENVFGEKINISVS